MTHASLADVLARGDAGPVPVSIALAIAIGAARALEAMPQRPLGLATTHLAIDERGFVLVVPGAMRVAYSAPEQVSLSGLDARSDVFSLGVILWELLAGRPLFERGSEGATKRAIQEEPAPDVRTQNTEVPQMVADVLASAVAKLPQSRYDTVSAFGRALAGARAATEVDDPPADAVARWVKERLARPVIGSAPSVPDLDLPGSSRVSRASGQMQATPASVRTAAAAAFSDLHLQVPAPAPVSSRQPPPPVTAPPPPTSLAPAHGIDFKSDDGDEFDMQIERNLVTTSLPTATSSRPSMTDGPPSSRRSGTGLELGAPTRLSARPTRPSSRPRDIGFFAKLLGFVVALVIMGGTAGALFRFLHRAHGRSLTALLPHAFDGTSANESGAVALVSLVVAVTVIFLGLRLRPHAWWIILAGAQLLFLALAMVTVTLASSGENGTPPDGALLVPYLTPAAAVFLALGLLGRAGRVFARSYGARKIGGVPLAVLAGGLAFAAFELSRLATLRP